MCTIIDAIDFQIKENKRIEASLNFIKFNSQNEKTISNRYKIKNENSLYFLTLTVVGWIDIFSRKQFHIF